MEILRERNEEGGKQAQHRRRRRAPATTASTGDTRDTGKHQQHRHRRPFVLHFRFVFFAVDFNFFPMHQPGLSCYGFELLLFSWYCGSLLLLFFSLFLRLLLSISSIGFLCAVVAAVLLFLLLFLRLLLLFLLVLVLWILAVQALPWTKWQCWFWFWCCCCCHFVVVVLAGFIPLNFDWRRRSGICPKKISPELGKKPHSFSDVCCLLLLVL